MHEIQGIVIEKCWERKLTLNYNFNKFHSYPIQFCACVTSQKLKCNVVSQHKKGTCAFSLFLSQFLFRSTVKYDASFGSHLRGLLEL